MLFYHIKQRVYVVFVQSFRNYSSGNGIYILSAARTPIGLPKGVLQKFSAQYLGAFTLKDVAQRAVLNKKDIKNVFLASSSCENFEEDIIKRTGFANETNIFQFKDGNICFREAVNLLMKKNTSYCIVGGMESASRLSPHHFENLCSLVKSQYKSVKSLINDNLISLEELNSFRLKDYDDFMKAVKSGVVLDEIVDMNYISQGNHIVINEDEIKDNMVEKDNCNFTPVLGDGAAAIVISSQDYVKQNDSSPLAKVLAFVNEPVISNNLSKAYSLALTKALEQSNISSTDIVRLEIDSFIPEVALSCIKNFNLNSTIFNKNGGYFCTGYLPGISGIKAVCHLVHSLTDGELGCVVMFDLKKTVSVLVIQKLDSQVFDKPHLTLYTKKICPLCTELKNQLKPFEGQFSLEEVDIEEKGNEKYEDLYKYDIPVLFLNGQYLCKHALNEQQFSRRLLRLKKMNS